MHYIQSKRYPRPDRSQSGPEIFAALPVVFDPATEMAGILQLANSLPPVVSERLGLLHLARGGGFGLFTAKFFAASAYHLRVEGAPPGAPKISAYQEWTQNVAWIQAAVIDAFDPVDTVSATAQLYAVQHRLLKHLVSVDLEWIQGSPTIYHQANLDIIERFPALQSQSRLDGQPHSRTKLLLNQRWIQDYAWIAESLAFDPTIVVGPSSQLRLLSYSTRIKPVHDLRYKTRGNAFGLSTAKFFAASAYHLRVEGAPPGAPKLSLYQEWYQDHAWIFSILDAFDPTTGSAPFFPSSTHF